MRLLKLVSLLLWREWYAIKHACYCFSFWKTTLQMYLLDVFKNDWRDQCKTNNVYFCDHRKLLSGCRPSLDYFLWNICLSPPYSDVKFFKVCDFCFTQILVSSSIWWMSSEWGHWTSFSSQVEFLVSKKAWPPAEISPAYAASIWLLTCVGSPVFNKVGVLTEFFSTFMTCEGLFSCMSSLVCMQICILTEAFPTPWTFIWFYSLVCC